MVRYPSFNLPFPLFLTDFLTWVLKMYSPPTNSIPWLINKLLLNTILRVIVTLSFEYKNEGSGCGRAMGKSRNWFDTAWTKCINYNKLVNPQPIRQNNDSGCLNKPMAWIRIDKLIASTFSTHRWVLIGNPAPSRAISFVSALSFPFLTTWRSNFNQN